MHILFEVIGFPIRYGLFEGERINIFIGLIGTQSKKKWEVKISHCNSSKKRKKIIYTLYIYVRVCELLHIQLKGFFHKELKHSRCRSKYCKLIIIITGDPLFFHLLFANDKLEIRTAKSNEKKSLAGENICILAAKKGF